MRKTLHYNYLWVTLGWAVIGIIIYLSLTPSPPQFGRFPSIDKLEHLLAYGVLMAWFTQIYLSKNIRIFWAILFCIMGILLEIIQGLGGHRYFEYADMMANTAGVLLGWWISSKFCAGWLARVDQMLSRK